MTVRVLLFAAARDAAGADAVEVELPARATFTQLAARLAESRPELAPLLRAARFASGAEYVSPDDPVDPAKETALIPPVSGG